MKTQKKHSSITIINEFPFQPDNWPGQWIWHSAPLQALEVAQCSLRFDPHQINLPLNIHVTADHRYKLYLNGELIGLGPQRGDLNNWYVDTYNLTSLIESATSTQVLTAIVWHYRENPPYAQIGFRPAFFLSAEGKKNHFINTSEQWYVRQRPEYQQLPNQEPAVHIRSSFKSPGLTKNDLIPTEDDIRTHFHPATVIPGPSGDARENHTDKCHPWNLKPRTIPALADPAIDIGQCRRITFGRNPQEINPQQLQIACQHLIDNESEQPIIIPPQTHCSILLDRQKLTNGYPILNISQGLQASIKLRYQEGLQSNPENPCSKGHRDNIENRSVLGVTDHFEADGRKNLILEPLWWRTWRYIEIEIITHDDPLFINNLSARYTGYPLEIKATFEAPSYFESLVEPCVRTLQLCANETYMDCPYYEQLQYIGDTRIQALSTYLIAGDDRLGRQAIHMFNQSRLPSGFTHSRYPSHILQIIPPFTLLYISMLYDFLMWRNDMGFVKQQLNGLRNILHTFCDYQKSDGLLNPLPHWCFVDWVNHPGWERGVPPQAENQTSYLISFNFLYALQHAVKIFEATDCIDEANQYRKIALKLQETLKAKAYDNKKQLFSDTPDHCHFSQHTNIFAILTGSCQNIIAPSGLLQNMLDDKDIAQTTYYFSFYLFEAMFYAGRGDLIWPALQTWHKMLSLGLSTFPETPEPTRSDCHAWSAHPLYHYFASILGMRPTEPLCQKIKLTPPAIYPNISPSLPESLGGTCMTPYGKIKVSILKQKQNWLQHISYDLPVEENIIEPFKAKETQYHLNELETATYNVKENKGKIITATITATDNLII